MPVEQEAAQGLVVLPVGNGEAEPVVDASYLDRGVYQVLSVADLSPRRVPRVVLVLYLADHLLHYVLERYDPDRPPVLVDHDRHSRPASLHLVHKLVYRLRFRNEERSQTVLLHAPLQVLLPQNGKRAQYPGDVVHPGGENRNPRMTLARDEALGLPQGGGALERVHVHQGDHDLSDRGLRVPENPAQNPSLVVLARLVLVLLHDVLELLPGDGPHFLARHAQNSPGEKVDEKQHGVEKFREKPQGVYGPEHDGVSPALENRLGNHLAEYHYQGREDGDRVDFASASQGLLEVEGENQRAGYEREVDAYERGAYEALDPGVGVENHRRGARASLRKGSHPYLVAGNQGYFRAGEKSLKDEQRENRRRDEIKRHLPPPRAARPPLSLKSFSPFSARP